jgi:hypothetical protein
LGKRKKLAEAFCARQEEPTALHAFRQRVYGSQADRAEALDYQVDGRTFRHTTDPVFVYDASKDAHEYFSLMELGVRVVDRMQVGRNVFFMDYAATMHGLYYLLIDRNTMEVLVRHCATGAPGTATDFVRVKLPDTVAINRIVQGRLAMNKQGSRMVLALSEKGGKATLVYLSR